MYHHELAEGERVKERRPTEPAPLPLHALLELQRAAGNQAVGRVLARVLKPARRTQLFSKHKTGKPKPTPEQILLRIYNELGHPTVYTDVQTAVDALILAGTIDQADATDFAGKAGYAAPNSGGQATANAQRLEQEIREDRPEVERLYSEHIFDGIWKVNGEPGGYHSTAGNSATHEAYGTETAIGGQGVYQQSVRAKDDHANIKETQSTFFPKTATKDQVLDAVTTVYGARGRAKGLSTVQHPRELKGITLQQIDGTTIFPAGGGPRRGEGWKSAQEKAEEARKNKNKAKS